MTGLASPVHIAMLLIVLLLVFGAKRLPELGRSLGGGMREFKRSLDSEREEQPPGPALVAVAPPVSPDPAPEPVPTGRDETSASRPAA